MFVLWWNYWPSVFNLSCHVFTAIRPLQMTSTCMMQSAADNVSFLTERQLYWKYPTAGARTKILRVFAMYCVHCSVFYLFAFLFFFLFFASRHYILALNLTNFDNDFSIQLQEYKTLQKSHGLVHMGFHIQLHTVPSQKLQ